MLSPAPSAAALADELAISAMARTLRDLPFDELADMSARARAYLAARLPLNEMYRFDSTALRVECIRRKAFHDPSASSFAAEAP